MRMGGKPKLLPERQKRDLQECLMLVEMIWMATNSEEEDVDIGLGCEPDLVYLGGD